MEKQEFWAINISKENVSVSDLDLTIPRGKCMELTRFGFTIAQLEESKTSGALYRKRNKILTSHSKPHYDNDLKKELSELPMQKPLRSAVTMKPSDQIDLLFSDEEYAASMAESMDEAPEQRTKPVK